MRAQVFIDQTEGGGVEISVIKDGLSFGAARKYHKMEEAKLVLLVFGFDKALVDRQFGILSKTPPIVLLTFPVTEIADDVLKSFGFWAAAFKAA
jgi:hypothetical protein